MNIINTLVPVRPKMLDKAALTVSGAFANDFNLKYALPDPAKRANYPRIIRYFLNLELKSGARVYATSKDCEGVIIWHMPGHNTGYWHKLIAGGLQLPFYAGWHYIWYTIREDRFCEQLKARHAPKKYIYLAILAVAPQHQQKGLGRKMLKALDEVSLQHKLPCYLETQNLKNVDMYSKYGFKLKESTFYPPGSKCEVHVMLKE
jgi:GNAT superfamily N-acetyltransferase